MHSLNHLYPQLSVYMEALGYFLYINLTFATETFDIAIGACWNVDAHQRTTIDSDSCMFLGAGSMQLAGSEGNLGLYRSLQIPKWS